VCLPQQVESSSGYIVRERGFIVWVVLGILLLVLLNLPTGLSRNIKAMVREGLAPLQGLVSGTSHKALETLESVRGIGGLVAENQQMAGELVRLRNEVNHLKSLETENISLRQQLRFTQDSSRHLIPAEVIARDISGWWHTLRVGSGSADGVELNRAVVTLDGLVGRTVGVSPRTADVLLLSDPTCRVSARISRTGSFGIVTGRGRSNRGQVICQMEFINKDAPVRIGDEVLTSGLGGVFPSGLLIGYVDRVVLDESGLYQRALVLPKADLGSVSYVFVVEEEGDPINELLRTKGLIGEGAL